MLSNNKLYWAGSRAKGVERILDEYNKCNSVI